MTLQRVTDHAEQAAAKLLGQFRAKPRLAGLVRSLVDGLQVIENAAWDIAEGRPLAVATGATLDAYGTLVGFPRAGLTDEAYRAVLRGVIAENNSDGTHAAAMHILDSLFQPKGIFAHTQMHGGNVGYGLWEPSVSPSLYRMMRGVFERSLAAGVRLAFLETFDAPAFAMAGPQPWVAGFDGVSSSSANLLAPNVARCGDTLGNVDEWAPCTQGEPFGTTTGGGGTSIFMNSFANGGTFDDTAWEGDKSLTIQTSFNPGERYGGKILMGGLEESTQYTASYYAMGYQASFGIFAELYWAGGNITVIAAPVPNAKPPAPNAGPPSSWAVHGRFVTFFSINT